jgi:Fe-S cluster assembly iron-binding protein IscA
LLILYFLFFTIFLFILGVTVIIDNRAVMNLVGTEMDFIDDDLRSEFVFKNPNSKVIKIIFYL